MPACIKMAAAAPANATWLQRLGKARYQRTPATTNTMAPENDVIQKAFLTVYGRPPIPAESDYAIAFLHKTTDTYSTHGVSAAKPIALEELLKALFASNEFMFVE